jgi:hypothetical protein
MRIRFCTQGVELSSVSDLMPEVTHASEHHHDAALVGGSDDLIISHAATRLDDAGRTGINHNI